MPTRIYKEIRLLLLPSAGVVIATMLAAWLMGARRVFPWQSGLGAQIAVVSFVVGMPLIIASSFGAEFHHRTLSLILAQPIARWRLWLEKWLTLVTVVVAVFVFQLTVAHAAGNWPRLPYPPAGFVAILLCATPLWTLVTRSTTGGLAVAGSTMMMLELAMSYLYYRVTGTLVKDVFADVPLFTVVRAVYAVTTLAGGWLLFVRYQVATPGGGEQFADYAGVASLRSRPRGAIANLVRKELMLHRTTFMVAAAFAICWLAATAIVATLDDRSGVPDVVFPFLLAVYLPLATVLAGTMGNSEDVSMGVHGWHLTLPVGTRAQWAIKLAVSLALGGLLVVALPATIAGITASLLPNGHASAALVKYTLILLEVCAVVVTFWASAVFGHTVPAAVATGVLLFLYAIGGVIAAVPLGQTAGRHVNLSVSYLADITIPRMSVDTVMNGLITAFALIVLAPAVVQSLSAFRRVDVSRGTVVRMSIVLLSIAWIAIFLLVFVIGALRLS